MTQAGAGVLASLKNKMQQLRNDLDKYKDLYEEKCQDYELEISKKQDVGSSFPKIVIISRWNTFCATARSSLLCWCDRILDIYYIKMIAA